jgi:hypothetical protein
LRQKGRRARAQDGVGGIGIVSGGIAGVGGDGSICVGVGGSVVHAPSFTCQTAPHAQDRRRAPIISCLACVAHQHVGAAGACGAQAFALAVGLPRRRRHLGRGGGGGGRRVVAGRACLVVLTVAHPRAGIDGADLGPALTELSAACRVGVLRVSVDGACSFSRLRQDRLSNGCCRIWEILCWTAGRPPAVPPLTGLGLRISLDDFPPIRFLARTSLLTLEASALRPGPFLPQPLQSRGPTCSRRRPAGSLPARPPPWRLASGASAAGPWAGAHGAVACAPAVPVGRSPAEDQAQARRRLSCPFCPRERPLPVYFRDCCLPCGR